jgi:hypothetical protein
VLIRGFAVRVAPLDGHTTLYDYKQLVNDFSIPEEFVSERRAAVTHSFGNALNDDGSECTFDAAPPV